MKRYILAAVAAVGLAGTGVSAATLDGTFWDAPANTFSNINDAISYATSNTADATFVSTGIDYGDGPGFGIGTLGDFLNADAGSITAGAGSTNFQESVLKLTGQVALNFGDTINVTSDDGFRLFVDGSVLSEFIGLRGPNNTSSATWAGASGVYSTTLWYFEGQLTQAQFVSNLGDFAVAPIPIPASALLLLTAFGGLGAMRRRRKAA